MGEGSSPNALALPGKEKSSISLFMITPVDGDRNPLPNLYWNN